MRGGIEEARGLSMSLSPPRALTHATRSLQLLVARRPGVFLIADLMVMLIAFASAMFEGGSAREIWTSLVLVPLLLLGIPVLSDVVALERRSGSLDLALASPGAATLFERRILAGLALFLAQAWLVILLAWVANDGYFPLVPALSHGLLLCLLLGSTTLFWAVRLRTPGAVVLATAGTIGLLAKWALRPPMPEDLVPGRYFLPWRDGLDWIAASAVILGASAVLYLHARRRLDRPEMLLR